MATGRHKRCFSCKACHIAVGDSFGFGLQLAQEGPAQEGMPAVTGDLPRLLSDLGTPLAGSQSSCLGRRGLGCMICTGPSSPVGWWLYAHSHTPPRLSPLPLQPGCLALPHGCPSTRGAMLCPTFASKAPHF